MDLFWIKIIGIITMFIDHYHYVIGGNQILNVIGRIAFPIFAFSLNEGYFHTSNLKKYLVRLFTFAVIIQIPAILFNLYYPVNIFFTLFFGLLAVSIVNLKNKFKIPVYAFILLKIFLIFFIFYVTKKFDFDYGIYGILLILVFNIFRNNKLFLLLAFFLLNLAVIIFPNVFGLFKIQFFSIFSLIFIFFYNGKRGKSLKYFFYLFYPIHFLILEGINFFLKKL
ncbi:TraX family protein [Leptotrichia sp. oral taxon 847]|uniref:TraX family protein n=1 Tax=Leptotrichia sp. oral taxon 847 TaxID=1785996 RepID=UPI0007682793|nr:TraX family protein [Leptotrichia sp. oral taxon 847]AMD95474.1 conjugal transfer protein TraX [Leptotrichia sp. oral taxon 847]